jgi:DNA-binding NarL/FixJ family response regulator
MKKVFIVDDHPTLREGLLRLVEQIPGYKVCGEATSVSEAMAAIPAAKPDMIITDITLPDRNGLEMIKDLQVLEPGIPILVFSMHDEMLYAERSLKAGARGYLTKGARTPFLLEAIETVTNGRVYLSPKMSEQVLSNLTRKRSTTMKLDSLSDRELEIFELIGLCRSSCQISGMLNISSKTVDAHRANIKAKLHLPDTPSLLREAVVWVEMGGKAAEQ